MLVTVALTGNAYFFVIDNGTLCISDHSVFSNILINLLICKFKNNKINVAVCINDILSDKRSKRVSNLITKNYKTVCTAHWSESQVGVGFKETC